VRLLLLRHAKSDRSLEIADHERPLSVRGEKAAPRIGAFLHTKNFDPAFVLCSTAERTKQTLERILPFLAGAPKIRYEARLYLAEWPELLAEIHGVPSGASPLLVIGHNPGLEQLASELARVPEGTIERRNLRKMTNKFPTAALAVLEFDAEDWQAVKPGSGVLADFVRPKDLPREDHRGS
jgi:phosphohistidine phosphatase